MDFKILHYNVLANSLSDGFPYVDPSHLSWKSRKKKIIKSVCDQKADVVCLVEVDEEHKNMFNTVYPKYFSFYSKKRSIDNKDGCLVLVNLNKFEVLDYSSFRLKDSRSQIAVLLKLKNIKTNYTFYLVSTHLKAKPGFEQIRLEQCSVIMDKIGDNDCIFLGDFNDVPNSLCYNFITKKHKFIDVYDNDKRIYTTCKKRDKLVCRVIDYIFYRSNKMKPQNEIQAPLLSSLPAVGLPSKEHPSDHVLLGVTFN